MKKIVSLFVFLFISANIFAQDNEVEMAKELFQSGKIYVVVTILSVIFIGIVAYLIVLDRKIRKIENESKSN